MSLHKYSLKFRTWSPEQSNIAKQAAQEVFSFAAYLNIEEVDETHTVITIETYEPIDVDYYMFKFKAKCREYGIEPDGCIKPAVAIVGFIIAVICLI